ncbi:MAG: hypothetical protein IKT83_07515 [Bacteroidaceae bacterium]|nr:hypothetical protein [Bacteroidaceae bacterium]
MKEVQIYHSAWRMLCLITASILLVCGGILIIHIHKSMLGWIAGWASILFFGCCTIVMAYTMLKERLTHQTFLTITDKYLITSSPETKVINFSDVESFSLKSVCDSKFITVRYKSHVRRQEITNSNIIKRIMHSADTCIIKAQDTITVTGLDTKPEHLLELLNERLHSL